jgi:hypothetical protein
MLSLFVLALALSGCVIVPYGPRRAYVAPVAVVAPAPVIGVRVYR